MKIRFNTQMSVPAARVWDLLWEKFGDVDQWAAGVSSSGAVHDDGGHVVGRTCSTDFGDVREEIEAVDQASRSISYSVEGMPFPIRRIVTSWRVESLDSSHSRVTTEARIDLVPIVGHLMAPLLRLKLRPFIRDTIAEMTTFLGTGQVHQRKKHALELATSQ